MLLKTWNQWEKLSFCNILSPRYPLGNAGGVRCRPAKLEKNCRATYAMLWVSDSLLSNSISLAQSCSPFLAGDGWQVRRPSWIWATSLCYILLNKLVALVGSGRQTCRPSHDKKGLKDWAINYFPCFDCTPWFRLLWWRAAAAATLELSRKAFSRETPEMLEMNDNPFERTFFYLENLPTANDN
jgi:hypothetical protein